MSGTENRGLETPPHKTSGTPEDPPEWDLTGEAFQVEEEFDLEGWNLAVEDLCNDGKQEEGLPSESWNALTEGASSSSQQLLEDQHEILQKIPSKKKKRVRGPKNWEFLIRLLVNPRSNPSLIRWEDETTATFRLVQPYAIAKFWSSRNSQAPPMSYNNFARGLRYHYSKGALEAVSEKQLVYRCGPKALRFLRALRPESSGNGVANSRT